MISEEEGFIPKHVTPLNPKYIEYGLSHFILVNFKRDLMRSTYHGNYDLVVLGIVQYLFGNLDPVCLEASAVSYATSQHLKDLIDQGIGTTRITGVANKINSLLKIRIPEEKENFLAGFPAPSTQEGLRPCSHLRSWTEVETPNQSRRKIID